MYIRIRTCKDAEKERRIRGKYRMKNILKCGLLMVGMLGLMACGSKESLPETPEENIVTEENSLIEPEETEIVFVTML